MLAVFLLGGWTGVAVKPRIEPSFQRIAHPATPFFLGSYADWTIWELDEQGSRICYAMTSSKSPRRGRKAEPALQVTRVPGQPPTDQVSVLLGYRHEGGKAVRARIDGGERFTFFTRDEPTPEVGKPDRTRKERDTAEKRETTMISRAWLEDADDDQAILGAMVDGHVMTVRGETRKGETFKDRFSLIGLTAAHQALTDICAGDAPDR